MLMDSDRRSIDHLQIADVGCAKGIEDAVQDTELAPSQKSVVAACRRPVGLRDVGTGRAKAHPRGIPGLLYILRFLLLLYLVSAFSSAVKSDITKDFVLTDIRAAYAFVDGIDALLNNALAEKLQYADVTWLEAFQFLFAAERIAERLQRQQYADAAIEASKYSSLAMFSKTSAGGALANATAIGNLAALPVTLSLNTLADTVHANAVDWQVTAYIAARSSPHGLSHADILKGRPDHGVFFTNDGWISALDSGTGIRGYRPQIPHDYTSSQFFDWAASVYSAHEEAKNLAEIKQNLAHDFAKILCRLGQDKDAPICRAEDHIPCHSIVSISPGSTPQQVGVPYDVFSSQQEPIIQGLCNRNSARIIVGSGSHIQLVYQTAHVRVGEVWEEMKLSGGKRAAAAGWFIGRAEAEITVPEDALQRGIDVLAYVCTWTPDGWRCGCRDAWCRNNGSWQQQRLERVRDTGPGYRFIWIQRSLDPVETDWLSSPRMMAESAEQYAAGYYPVRLEGKNVVSGARYRARFEAFPTLPFYARWEWRLSAEAFNELDNDMKSRGFALTYSDSFSAGRMRKKTEYQGIWVRLVER